MLHIAAPKVATSVDARQALRVIWQARGHSCSVGSPLADSSAMHSGSSKSALPPDTPCIHTDASKQQTLEESTDIQDICNDTDWPDINFFVVRLLCKYFWCCVRTTQMQL